MTHFQDPLFPSSFAFFMYVLMLSKSALILSSMSLPSCVNFILLTVILSSYCALNMLNNCDWSFGICLMTLRLALNYCPIYCFVSYDDRIIDCHGDDVLVKPLSTYYPVSVVNCSNDCLLCYFSTIFLLC